MKKALLYVAIFLAGVATAFCQQAAPPDAELSRIKEANAFYNNKDYPKALSLYTKAAEENPKNTLGALAHYKCAKVLVATGKDDDAISECSKSIAIDPTMNKAIAYILRAYLYEKCGKIIEAIFDYSKALIVNPDDKETWVRRQRLLIGMYVQSTREGVAAFSSGLAAYKGNDDASARKDLDKAALLFAQAAGFNIGDKTAFAMADATKGLTFQIMTRETLEKMKSASSDKEASGRLASAYYTLAVTNAYYKKAIPLVKNEKLKNSLNELNSENDKDMETVRPRLAGLKSSAQNYIKGADLEASCIVNFDAAGLSITIGDNKEAKRILNENSSMVPDLRKLKSANAEGINYMTNAYAGLNAIFSSPLTDRSWLKANKKALDRNLDDCLNDLKHAQGAVRNKELVNNCSSLSKNVSALKDILKKVGDK